LGLRQADAWRGSAAPIFATSIDGYQRYRHGNPAGLLIALSAAIFAATLITDAASLQFSACAFALNQARARL
jgi:predicted aconitase